MAKKATQKRVKVLYQNLGGVWYAFTTIDDSLYFGKVPVSAAAPKAASAKKKGSSARPSRRLKSA